MWDQGDYQTRIGNYIYSDGDSYKFSGHRPAPTPLSAPDEQRSRSRSPSRDRHGYNSDSFLRDQPEKPWHPNSGGRRVRIHPYSQFQSFSRSSEQSDWHNRPAHSEPFESNMDRRFDNYYCNSYCNSPPRQLPQSGMQQPYKEQAFTRCPLPDTEQPWPHYREATSDCGTSIGDLDNDTLRILDEVNREFLSMQESPVQPDLPALNSTLRSPLPRGSTPQYDSGLSTGNESEHMQMETLPVPASPLQPLPLDQSLLQPLPVQPPAIQTWLMQTGELPEAFEPKATGETMSYEDIVGSASKFLTEEGVESSKKCPDKSNPTYKLEKSKHHCRQLLSTIKETRQSWKASANELVQSRKKERDLKEQYGKTTIHLKAAKDYAVELLDDKKTLAKRIKKLTKENAALKQVQCSGIQSHKLAIRESGVPGAGEGLFTDESIDSGVTLGEYHGEMIYRLNIPGTDQYIVWRVNADESIEFIYDDTFVVWIDHSIKQNGRWHSNKVEAGVDGDRPAKGQAKTILRKSNHSNNTNMGLYVTNDNKVMFYTTCAIKAGQELFWDYDPNVETDFNSTNCVDGVKPYIPTNPLKYVRVKSNTVELRSKYKPAKSRNFIRS